MVLSFFSALGIERNLELMAEHFSTRNVPCFPRNLAKTELGMMQTTFRRENKK